MKEQIKRRIVDVLDKANEQNYRYNVGFANGFETFLTDFMGVDIDNDYDIQAAYARLCNRLHLI